MIDTHLYLAIGIPGSLFALNFLALLAGFFWQSKRFEDLAVRFDTRFDALEKVMDARFESAQQALLRVAGTMNTRA